MIGLFASNGVTLAIPVAPDPTHAGTITAQAVIALPPLSPDERLVLAGASRSAISAAGGYSRDAILSMTAAPDGTVQSLTDDHLRIGLHFAAGRDKELLTVLEAILTRPAFLPEALNADVAAAGSPREVWNRIGMPPMAPIRSVAPEEARRVWAKVVRPERLVLAFGGGEAPALAVAWDARKIEWPAIPAPSYRAEANPVAPLPGPAQVGVLEGDALAGDADLGPTLLALTALGAGKGSLAWRTLRTERGASYAVAATLAGVPDGWRPRLVFDLAAADDGEDAKARLVAGIETLSEPDLLRARGLLGAILSGESDETLFAPDPRHPGRALPDRAYLAAYLRLKTGRLAALPPVPEMTLEDLKATLRRLVEGMTLRLQK